MQILTEKQRETWKCETIFHKKVLLSFVSSTVVCLPGLALFNFERFVNFKRFHAFIDFSRKRLKLCGDDKALTKPENKICTRLRKKLSLHSQQSISIENLNNKVSTEPHKCTKPRVSANQHKTFWDYGKQILEDFSKSNDQKCTEMAFRSHFRWTYFCLRTTRDAEFLS